MTDLPKCPDCGVLPGKAHNRNCDVARCLKCGGQRLSCGCTTYTKDIWTGVWPGKEECERLGFWCLPIGEYGQGGYRPVPAGHPGAIHDLNRLAIETVWNPKTKTCELRKKPEQSQQMQSYLAARQAQEDAEADLEARKSGVDRCWKLLSHRERVCWLKEHK